MLGEAEEPLTTATLPAKRRHVVRAVHATVDGRHATAAVKVMRRSGHSATAGHPAAGGYWTARMGHGRHQLSRSQARPPWLPGFPALRMIATGYQAASPRPPPRPRRRSSRSPTCCWVVRGHAGRPVHRGRLPAAGRLTGARAAMSSTSGSTMPMSTVGRPHGGVRRGGVGGGARRDVKGVFHLTRFLLPLLRSADTEPQERWQGRTTPSISTVSMCRLLLHLLVLGVEGGGAPS